ncbi:MAG: hypothetical protein Q8N04_12140 [Nitrospira sp.]|nr:hypothetical protein [Nitrospira sp.]
MVKVSRKSVAKSVGIDCCHRCGGLMVPEPVHELASYDWRCVSCGERIDPVILAHRRQSAVEPERGYIGTRQREFSLS